MKKLLTLIIPILLCSVLVLAGCSEPAPAPTPTPSSTPTSTPSSPSTSTPTSSPTSEPTSAPEPTAEPEPTSEPEEVITLRYACMDSETSWTAEYSLMPWIEAVEAATGGRVQFEVYWSNTLCKPMDNWEAVKSGIADAGVCAMPFWPGLAPLSDVISLPALGIVSSEQGGAVFWNLYEKYPSIRDEFKDVHMLFSGVSNPNIFITVDKPVKTIDDIEGMKIRVTGGPPTDYLKSLDASPMLVAMVDVYTNLQKGVIDGVLSSWTSVESMNFHEVANYVSEVPVYSTYAIRAMNVDTWNSLPPDIQEAITSVSGYERSVLFSKTQFDDHVDVVREKGYGMNVYTPTAEELAAWQEAAYPIWEKWVSDMEEAGHPEAQEILDTALELVETYRP